MKIVSNFSSFWSWMSEEQNHLLVVLNEKNIRKNILIKYISKIFIIIFVTLDLW
jgi:hypothetical protein